MGGVPLFLFAARKIGVGYVDVSSSEGLVHGPGLAVTARNPGFRLRYEGRLLAPARGDVLLPKRVFVQELVRSCGYSLWPPREDQGK